MSGRPLNHDELQDLLGAYALDAVDADERDLLDAHLRECPRCRAEVADHRETAALLANAGADAPPGVWDRINATIEGPAPSVVRLENARRRRSPALVGAAALAAAAVVAIALLGWRVVDQGDRIDRMQAALQRGGVAQAALAAEADPGARTVELVTTDGRALATAVVLADGTGYLVRDRFDALGPDRTYQLWAVVGDRTISAGVLGNDPSVLAFRAPSQATALAVTAEVAGGVVRSQQTPIAAGEVRDA